MEFLIWLVVGLGAGAGAVGVNMFSNEMYDRCPQFARWLLRKAVLRLPEHRRARYEEEWLAHAQECDGKLELVSHAAQCWICAHVLARQTKHVPAVKFATLEVRVLTPNGHIVLSRNLGSETKLNAVGTFLMGEYAKHSPKTEEVTVALLKKVGIDPTDLDLVDLDLSGFEQFGKNLERLREIAGSKGLRVEVLFPPANPD